MEGILVGVLHFAAAGAGIFSMLTGSSVSDLYALLTGSASAGGSYLVNMYTNYWTILRQGLNFNGGWGIILLAWSVVLFIIVMVINFVTTRNETLVR